MSLHTPSGRVPEDQDTRARTAHAVSGPPAQARRELRRSRTFLRVYVAILALFLAGFLALAALADTHTVLTFDVVVTRAIQGVRLPLYQWILVHESDLGFSPLSPFTFVAVFALLFVLGQRLDAVLAVLSALLAGLLGGGIKLLIARARPSSAFVHVTAHLNGYGFPSGHVIQYTTLFGFACYAIFAGQRRTLWRDALLTLLALLVVLVGPSRVYLGEHWPTDAFGAYLLSGLWLAGTIEIQRALLRRALSHQRLAVS